MNWSKEFPKSPGYYWFIGFDEKVPKVVRIVEYSWVHGNKLWMQFILDDQEVSATDGAAQGQFAGPIQVPVAPGAPA